MNVWYYFDIFLYNLSMFWKKNQYVGIIFSLKCDLKNHLRVILENIFFIFNVWIIKILSVKNIKNTYLFDYNIKNIKIT